MINNNNYSKLLTDEKRYGAIYYDIVTVLNTKVKKANDNKSKKL